MRNKVAISLASNAVTASLNGKPVVSCGTAPALTGMAVGKGDTAPLRGSVEKCLIYDSAYNSTDLALLAFLTGAMYDDFDRADGAVGTAWTGQTYEQTGTAASSLISSQRVVTTDSGGASTSAYYLVDMGTKPKIFGGAMAYENNAGSADTGLISTPNDTSISQGTAAPGITALSFHFLPAPPGLFAGVFLNNVLNDHQWNFSSTATQPKDGTTLGTTVWQLRPSDGAIAVRVFNGETEFFFDENYYSYAGRYVINESFGPPLTLDAQYGQLGG